MKHMVRLVQNTKSTKEISTSKKLRLTNSLRSLLMLEKKPRKLKTRLMRQDSEVESVNMIKEI